jgi:hypothetical protein
MNRPHEVEYVGNLHIHTRHSDGVGNVEEIAQSASRAGLTFILINDHDFMMDDLHLEEEGLYGGVFVFCGLEIGKMSHHYLAYDLREMVRQEGLDPQGVIDLVNKQGGFGFLAHPFEKGMPFSQRSIAYTWDDLSVTGFSGICIWNFMSRWKERIKSPVHGLYCILFKSQSLRGPSRETLSFWDHLCQKRRLVAIGGSDAHGGQFQWGLLHLRPVSYDLLMKSINMHILLRRPLAKGAREARRQIYDAMREGHLYIAHENLERAKGFRFWYVSDRGSSLSMGDEGPYAAGHLHVEVPQGGKIHLIRNGRLEQTWRGRKGVYRVGREGVYRVEVYRRLLVFGWRPWIFSNPIYLRSPEGAQRSP